MPEYLHPGVYIEEVRSGPRPIEGASTSTVGFVGVTQKGRPNHPTFISSWGQFVSKFGGLIANSFLSYAVSKFFDNGGKRCYIVRVLNELTATTAEASVPIRRGGRDALRIHALGGGAWGDSVSVRVEDGTESPTREFKLVVLSEGQAVEIFDNLTLDPNGLAYVESEINEVSEFIEVEDREGHEVRANATLVSSNPLADPVAFLGGGETFTVETPEGATQTETFTGNVARDDVVNRINTTMGPAGVTASLDATNNLVLARNDAGFDQYFRISGAATAGGRPLEFPATFGQGSGPAIGGVLKSALATGAPLGFDTSAGNNLLDITVHGDALPQIVLTQGVGTPIETIQDEIDQALRTNANGLVSVGREGDRLVLTTANRGAQDTALAVAGSADGVLQFRDFDRVGAAANGFGGNDAAFVQSEEGPFNLAPNASFSIQANNGTLGAEVGAAITVLFTAANVGNLQSVTATEVANLITAAAGGEVTAAVVNNRVVVSQARSGNYYYLDLQDGANQPNITLGFEAGRTPGFVDGDRSNPYFRPAFNIVSNVNEPHPLSGGSDGSPVSNIDYIGSAATKTGMHALDDIDDVSIVVAPGRGDAALISAGVDYCTRRGDCFFIADSPEPVNGTITNPQQAKSFLQNDISSKTSYGALYYPWVEANDPIGAGRDPKTLLPPSGYLAGLYARTDNSRGVWKAPAGTEASLAGALDLEYVVSDSEQDILNPVGVNVVRSFAASGKVVWGARTLGTRSDAQYRYVPVRRLAIFLEVSIFRGIQWAVFEPNGPELWATVKATIDDFLMGVFLQGGLAGTKPSEAFQVRIDSDLNPQSEIDAGRLNVEVKFAPLKPAEFVIIRISQKRPGD